MKTTRHYENVPEAYGGVRRPVVEVDTRPEPTPEEKRAELEAIADKFTAVNEEKPRRRVRAI